MLVIFIYINNKATANARQFIDISYKNIKAMSSIIIDIWNLSSLNIGNF